VNLLRRLGLLLLLLPACKHAPPKPGQPETVALRARDFYPLKVGNQWTYEIRSSGQKSERTIKILAESDGFFVDNMHAKLRQDETGLRDEHRYLLENPVSEGHKWFSVLSLQATEHFEITEAGHPCSARAGTFGECVTVKSTNELGHGRTLVLESTYAQGVGLVALRTSQVEKDSAPVTQVELELVTYRFQP
jgi:hypothetical protein